MKKLLLLLSVLLVLAASTSSAVFASRSSFEYRIQSLLAIFCQNVIPLSGVIVDPGDIIIIPASGGNGWGPRLGGDADDLANGKRDGKPINVKGSSGELKAQDRGRIKTSE